MFLFKKTISLALIILSLTALSVQATPTTTPVLKETSTATKVTKAITKETSSTSKEDNVPPKEITTTSKETSTTPKDSLKTEVKSTPTPNIAVSNSKKSLIDGNKRFVSGNYSYKTKVTQGRRDDLATNGQHPLAIVLCCSDSRVPPEIVFDQALGDLFVISSAGNIIDKVGLGSIEYAVEQIKSPFLVVLGHDNCDAVKSTVDGEEFAGSIDSIIEKISPSLSKVKSSSKSKEELYTKCEDENIRAMIKAAEKSKILKEAVKAGDLQISGAKYHLESGSVDFL